MKPQRLKSVDIFRGLCMSWMVLGHLIDWWLKSEYNWLHKALIMILDPIGASGFLFIAGVSTTLSYRSRLIKVKISEDYNYKMVRNSYLFRALLILIIAIFFNFCLAAGINDPSWIWTWFFLLTVAVSLFMAWPLLKTSKMFRIIFGTIILIVNQFIIGFLVPYKGDLNLFGILFRILYSDMHQDPILTFFPFFLFGTVIGEIIFDSYLRNNQNERKMVLKKNLLIPSIITGILLIIIGVIFNFPTFLNRESFSWIIYSLGINLILLTILLAFEEFKIIKTKKSYKVLFYYSYYSLTIYLAHNLLYFLFYNQLNAFNIWILVAMVFIIISILFRVIYKKWEGYASIKVQIGRLSSCLTMKIENIRGKRINERKN